MGRDYLKVGYYTESFFAERDIRYIAINDGVDSDKGDNDFTPFRNLFNGFYARDTSKKIRAVMRAIDFSYVRGLVSRPATCFDGGCRRQGASPVPYQWFARQEGGCDGVHHIGLRREVPAENRGQDRRGHARRR